MNDDRRYHDLLNDPAEFAQYSRRLAVLAGRHLSDRLRTRVDSDDIVQSAMRTFFRRYEHGEFVIESSTELWSLLAHITVRKAQTHARYENAGKRTPDKEVSAHENAHSRSDPTADEVVAVEDLIDKVLTGLPEKHGEILGLLLEGHSRTDVANHLGLSRMSVHRVLNVLQDRLKLELE